MDKATIDVLTCVSTVLSTVALIGTVFVMWWVAKTQQKLTQRQLLIPLWEYMSKLGDMSQTNPPPKQVQETVNTLELVALCCEGGMVDEAVIKRTFRAPFVHLYDIIDRLPEVENLGKTGRQLLAENPSAMSFYDRLAKELKDRDKLAKIG